MAKDVCAKDSLKFVAPLAYVLMLVIFLLSFLTLLKCKVGHSEMPLLTYNSGGTMRERTVSFASRSFAGTTGLALTFDEFQYGEETIFITSVSGCLLTFVITFLAIPGYAYFNYKRPARELIKVIKAQKAGTDVAANPPRNIRQLGGLTVAVYDLIQTQQKAEQFIDDIGQGKLDATLKYSDSSTHLAKALQGMQNKLRQLSQDEKRQNWVNEKLSLLERILKEKSENEVPIELIRFITKSVNAGVGVLYGYDAKPGEEHFFYLASSGLPARDTKRNNIEQGQGQLGQLAIEKATVRIDNAPKGYLFIESGLGEASSAHILLVPLMFKNEIYGALELGAFHAFEQYEIAWLERASESVAAHLFNKKTQEEAKERLQELAAKQAEELVEVHRLQANTFNKLELKLREVEDEKLKTERVLEGCVDGVITFTERGEITFCNRAVEEILSMDRNEIFKRRIFDIVPMRIDTELNTLKAVIFNEQYEREVRIRTEATVETRLGEKVDVLITSSQFQSGLTTMFTFFIQKISADLF